VGEGSLVALSAALGTAGLRTGVCTSTSRPGAPFNGQLIYETDTKKVYIYNGSSWVEQPTAGMVDAKGDLLVGTAADTAARLAVGTNGKVLEAASGETTGLKWGNAVGLQYISSTTFTTVDPADFLSVFTSSFKNYRVILRYTGGQANAVYLRLIAGTTVQTNTIYSLTGGNSTGSTGWAGSERNDSYGQFVACYPTYHTSVSLDFFAPQASEYTAYVGNYVTGLSATSQAMGTVSGRNSVTTSIDGFQLTTAGATNITGTMVLYGYRD
jgi:hypothetical protein